ncbi:MAG: M28 family peptidase [Halobacteriales archaeon]|nr:M28 family peptidase [Halobacteriales archaeon]
MLEPIDRETEDQLLDEIDREELQRHLEVFDGLERVSGTADEWEASEYVIETLEEYGVDATLHEYEGYISVPEEASVEVTTPTGRRIDDAITTSFSASTPPSGIHGEVVHLGEIDAESVDPAVVENKLVFSRGLPTPDAVNHLETAGAAGLIMESVTEGYLHEMIVTPIWGTPSTKTADRLPELPVVEIKQTDGDWLRERLAHGPVEATITTAVTTELTTLPCPVGKIDGAESDRYFVIGNHVDSWHEGLTDNATAMAATLEIARIFADREPNRGLVFGFWSAHSTGRYAGSTWYNDEHWLDLRDNGVAYLHLDLNGLKGADSLSTTHMAELEDEQLDAAEITRFSLQEPEDSILGSTDRPSRNSDQSFWGTGLSSLLSGGRLTPGTEEGGPVGGGWWWHTPADTLDKVDLDVLTEEIKLYLALSCRICESPVLPHDYTATVEDIRAVLDAIADEAGEAVAFDDLDMRLNALRGALKRANGIINERAGTDADVAAAAEDLQVELGNQLIPALYMEEPDYEQDPALPHKRLPYLRVAEDLPELQGRDRRFAETTIQRGKAKLGHRIERARAATTRFIDAYGE